VAALNGDALFGEGGDHAALHVFLRRPTHLIGRQAQVAAGDENGFVRAEGSRLGEVGDLIGGQGNLLFWFFSTL
jgi:hypothetical protein